MNAPNGSSSVKKQEDLDPGPDTKPLTTKQDAKTGARTLNRVPRACNACRKQKMRCEGAESPPCRRCRHAGLECLFEKPTREASLTGEAGLERIRSLEAHVADIRQSQVAIQSTLNEIVSHLRTGVAQAHRSPSVYHQQPFIQQSPSSQSHGSPATSTPTSVPHSHPQLMLDTHSTTSSSQQAHSGLGTPSHSISSAISSAIPRYPQQQNSFQQSSSVATPGHRPTPTGEIYPQQTGATHSPYSQTSQPTPTYAVGHHIPVLPPFSSIETSGSSRSQPNNVSSVRYHTNADASNLTRLQHPRSGESLSGMKRSSNATSADSTDNEEEDNGELPAKGLVAPWEVLRGLADVAVERASKENGDDSQPQSRARTPDQDPRRTRPAKRRKMQHKPIRTLTYHDVVTKDIISEAEARQLFQIFYHGCSTFLPVFDGNVDTFDALHERSPFAVNCICMVAAKVRDGGGKPSEVYVKCLEEVQTISSASLFSPVTRQEAVQAMILVSGWSDNGWLSGGHAVRMAMELSMHKSWPELLKRMKAGKLNPSSRDRELISASRTWFCLYLFEHQMSYGSGRPAILKDDESIWGCRMLLQHPLAIEDDMRLISTVELMAIRERIINKLQPIDGPVDDSTFSVLREADAEFNEWYTTWDRAFSQKYENAAFYRQSLQIQHIHAELYHNAIALRGINGPTDVQQMPIAQRDLALRSISIALKALELTVSSPSYREGMKYAVHYTHASATFSASLLLRLIRLFPDECNVDNARTTVEHLAVLMSEIPGKRYAVTLQLMLKRSRKRRDTPISHSSKGAREVRHQRTESMDYTETPIQPVSPTYDATYTTNPESMTQMAMGPPDQASVFAANVDNIWRGFEAAPNEQIPVWLSDQTLGGHSFQQNGMDAFLLPQEFFPPAPQIW